MQTKILSNCIFAIICITIQAAIFAGIISSNIDTGYTSTFCSLICIFFYIKLKSTNSFNSFPINTMCMFDSKFMKITNFCTCINI